MDITIGLGAKELHEFLSTKEWELREIDGMPILVNIRNSSNVKLVNSFAFETLKKREIIAKVKTKGITKIWKWTTIQTQLKIYRNKKKARV